MQYVVNGIFLEGKIKVKLKNRFLALKLVIGELTSLNVNLIMRNQKVSIAVGKL